MEAYHELPVGQASRLVPHKPKACAIFTLNWSIRKARNMRQVLPLAIVCLSLTLPAFPRSGHASGGGAHASGGGAAHTSGGTARMGAARTGIYRGGGFRGGYGYRPTFRSGFRYYRPGIYPWIYGGLYNGYGYGYSDPYWDSQYSYPDAGYNYPASDYGYQSDQAPPVIVNQEFQQGPPPQPMVREYTTPGPPAGAPAQSYSGAPAQSYTGAPARTYEAPLYLIAFHAGDIKAVLAYWVQGTSLHYVTLDHEQKQVTLASVDRPLSERLNGERNVAFQLPR